MDMESTSMLLPKSSVRHLIHKLTVMCSKPSVDSDLTGVLDEFMIKMRESQIYLSNGIFTTNFAEAALFIDSAVILYGKKIDLMWDNLIDYQKRMLSYERKTEKSKLAENQLEDRRQKYKRKRKLKGKQPAAEIDEATLDLMIEGAVNKLDDAVLIEDDLTFEDDEKLTEDRNAICVKYLPKQTSLMPFIAYKRDGFTNTSYKIYDDEDEYMCDNNQFMTERMLFLISEFTRQIAYNLYRKRDVELIGYDIRDKLLQRFIVEKGITKLDKTNDMTRKLNAYIKLLLEMHRKHNPDLLEEHKKSCMRRSSILLTRLPDDVLESYLKNSDSESDDTLSQSDETDKIVTKPDLSNDSAVSPSKSGCHDLGSTVITSQSSQLHNGNGDSGFFEPSLLESTNEFLDDTNDNDPNDCVTDTESCTAIIPAGNEICSDITHAGNDNTDSITENNEDESLFNRDAPIITSTPTTTLTASELKSTIRERRVSSKILGGKRNLSEILIDDHDTPKKVRKRIKAFKWLKTTTSKLKAFEKFYHFNYAPEDGEGCRPEQEFSDSEEEEVDIGTDLPPVDEQLDSSLQDGSLIPNLCDSSMPQLLELVDAGESAELQEYMEPAEYVTVTEPIEPITPVEPTVEEDFTDLLAERYIRPALNELSDYDRVFYKMLKDRQKSQAQFLEWKDFIETKLATSDKVEFDIHEYGTVILNQLPAKEPVLFGSLVQGKKSSEVVRYFIASLQLANTHNVELRSSSRAQLGNDSLNLKLLSKERHHENLSEYHAPSEESLRKKLAHVNTLKLAGEARKSSHQHCLSKVNKRRKMDYG